VVKVVVEAEVEVKVDDERIHKECGYQKVSKDILLATLCC